MIVRMANGEWRLVMEGMRRWLVDISGWNPSEHRFQSLLSLLPPQQQPQVTRSEFQQFSSPSFFFYEREFSNSQYYLLISMEIESLLRSPEFFFLLEVTITGFRKEEYLYLVEMFWILLVLYFSLQSILLLWNWSLLLINRFVKLEDRKRALVSRLLQYSLVTDVLGIPFDKISILHTTEGKPYLVWLLQCMRISLTNMFCKFDSLMSYICLRGLNKSQLKFFHICNWTLSIFSYSTLLPSFLAGFTAIKTHILERCLAGLTHIFCQMVKVFLYQIRY